MKRCPKCDTYKYEEAFYNNKAQPDGLEAYCKPCKKEQVAAYHKTDKGKVTAAKAQRTWINTPHGRAKKQELDRQWYKTVKGRAHSNSKSLRRYWSDPEYYRLKAIAQRIGCDVGVLKQVRERDTVCQRCSATEDLQFDHIWPDSLGGKGTFNNLQLLCEPCNNFKSNNLFLPGGGMLVTPQHCGIRMIH